MAPQVANVESKSVQPRHANPAAARREQGPAGFLDTLRQARITARPERSDSAKVEVEPGAPQAKAEPAKSSKAQPSSRARRDTDEEPVDPAVTKSAAQQPAAVEEDASVTDDDTTAPTAEGEAAIDADDKPTEAVATATAVLAVAAAAAAQPSVAAAPTPEPAATDEADEAPLLAGKMLVNNTGEETTAVDGASVDADGSLEGDATAGIALPELTEPEADMDAPADVLARHVKTARGSRQDGEADAEIATDATTASPQLADITASPDAAARPTATVLPAGDSTAAQPVSADPNASVGVVVSQAPSSAPATDVKAPAPLPNLPPEAQFADANHGKIVSGMSGQLLPNGGTMQIRLDPPHLGPLQVSVHMRDGVVTAAFETQNDDATRLLSHSLGQLKSALESQGITVDKLQVQQAPKDQQADSNPDDPRQGQQGAREGLTEQQNQRQRQEMLRRMWQRLNGDPLDLVA